VNALLTLAAVAWFVLLIVTPLLPPPLSGALYAAGSLICHQRPERSFHIAGAQLPVCARCIGIYGGAAIGAIVALRAGRVRHPRGLVLLAVLPAVVSLVVEWTGVGRPSNAVRAATGVIAGAVIAAVVLATLHYERCVPPRPTAPNPPTSI
jgi:uncharacterized membrane protein